MAYKKRKGLLAQKMSGEKKPGALPMRSPNKNYKNPRDYRVFNWGNPADPPLEMGDKTPAYMKSPVKQDDGTIKSEGEWIVNPKTGDKFNTVTGETVKARPHGERPVRNTRLEYTRDGNVKKVTDPLPMKSSGFKMKEGSPFQRNFGVGDSPAKVTGTHKVFLDEEGNVKDSRQVGSLRGFDNKYDLSRAKTKNLGTIEAHTSKETGRGKGEGLERTEGSGTRTVVMQDGWDALQNVLKNPNATSSDKRAAKNQYNLWKKQVGDQYANRDELISRALSMGKISSVDDLSRKYKTTKELNQLADQVGLANKKGLGITDAEREAGTTNLADWQANVVKQNIEGSLEEGVTPILPGAEKIKESGAETVTFNELDVDPDGKQKTSKIDREAGVVRKSDRRTVKDENVPEDYEGELDDKYEGYSVMNVPRPYSEIIYPQGGSGSEPATTDVLTEDFYTDNLGYGQVYGRSTIPHSDQRIDPQMVGEGKMFDALQESKDILAEYGGRHGMPKDERYYKHKKLIENYEKQKNLRDE